MMALLHTILIIIVIIIDKCWTAHWDMYVDKKEKRSKVDGYKGRWEPKSSLAHDLVTWIRNVLSVYPSFGNLLIAISHVS